MKKIISSVCLVMLAVSLSSCDALELSSSTTKIPAEALKSSNYHNVTIDIISEGEMEMAVEGYGFDMVYKMQATQKNTKDYSEIAYTSITMDDWNWSQTELFRMIFDHNKKTADYYYKNSITGKWEIKDYLLELDAYELSSDAIYTMFESIDDYANKFTEKDGIYSLKDKYCDDFLNDYTQNNDMGMTVKYSESNIDLELNEDKTKIIKMGFECTFDVEELAMHYEMKESYAFRDFGNTEIDFTNMIMN